MEADILPSETGNFFIVEPALLEESFPRRYRLARKHDGSLIMQGEFYWFEGMSGGSEWREIPIIELDN